MLYKSCTDGGNPTKNLIFEWTVTLRDQEKGS